MIQYYLKQKVFSLRDRYKIFDLNQNELFHVEGKLFSFVHKKDFYENQGNLHLFTLTRRLFRLLPVYDLSSPEGEMLATIRKRFTVFVKKLDITGRFGDYTIEGDIFAHNFQVIQNGKVIVDVQKKWISWGDTYEISIFEEEHKEFLLALVIMIDDCMHERNGQGHIHIG